ncbi:helix-turn-helix transcriptional regulator [Lentisalinibacter salinarum]|uniref:helix-turn-helix transcriptional regulator n=1 Tax=Lentisalinibacter salinarum TaxID=2992239 RepID=UPI0038637ED2
MTDQTDYVTLPDDDDVLLDERFVARYYGQSDRTVKEWRYTGRGPRYIRLGKTQVRYRVGDLRAFNRERAARSTAEESVRDENAGSAAA